MRWVGLIGALVLLLTGCGGDGGLSADEYRERLDEGCRRFASAFARLPHIVRDRDLDLDEAGRYAERLAARFEDRIRALDPPADLQDAHEELLRAGDAPPQRADDVQALRRRSLRFAEIYDSLGARECARRQRRAAKTIRRAS